MAAALFGLEKRDQPISHKVSVIVPCHSDHFPLLRTLLLQYQGQSVKPDEIVIALSNAGAVDPHQLGFLKKCSWPFELKIIESPHQQEPAVNRNLACRASTGDLIICQDADDLPHRQRVQVIKYLFEHYEIDFFSPSIHL